AEMEELAKHTAVVCFGTLAQRSEVTRKTIEAYVAAMPEEAVKVCDINLRGNYYSKEIIESSLKMSDMIKVNREEFFEMCRLVDVPCEDQHMAAHTLIDDYKLDILVITCGTEGSFVYCQDDNASCLPTPKVEVVDTVGAGDAFTGVFVSGMLGGLEVRWAHMLAVEAAAFVCTQAGAMPELPEDIKERV
ncbi:MAG: carbohydrate kinase, partial [Alistipes sp.]|nr:carbohydrate kinase [Alistipes sp.]MBQ5618609.1 carbohydrate kinase [Alistipes sp.]MBQ5922807.1 carbohydrate kinase [Alistipes sp.]